MVAGKGFSLVEWGFVWLRGRKWLYGAKNNTYEGICLFRVIVRVTRTVIIR